MDTFLCIAHRRNNRCHVPTYVHLIGRPLDPVSTDRLQFHKSCIQSGYLGQLDDRFEPPWHSQQIDSAAFGMRAGILHQKLGDHQNA